MFSYYLVNMFWTCDGFIEECFDMEAAERSVFIVIVWYVCVKTERGGGYLGIVENIADRIKYSKSWTFNQKARHTAFASL